VPRNSDYDYPPAEWRVDDVAEALWDSTVEYPIPTYSNEDFWRTVREDDAVQGIVAAAREHAATVADEPVTPLPASGYLTYEREGVREGFPEKRRRRNLAALALAECLDRGGYADPILDRMWAMCEQSTWTKPPHFPDGHPEEREGLPRPVDPEDRRVALQTAGTARLLAEVRYVLGDRLHPAARERVAREIDERVLTAYLANDDFGWLEGKGNWNAVCNGSVLIAALHVVEDTERLAGIVRKAARSLEHYLASFDADGCTAEGMGYWKYGFGFYVSAAAHLDARTDDALSLFEPPVVEVIGRFPLKTELSPNRYPAFSDASEREDVTPYIACELGRRFDDTALLARGRDNLRSTESVGYFPSAIRNLAWCRMDADADADVGTGTASTPARSFFRGHQWWISRVSPGNPDGFVIAAKGGHNGEPHNHNDCGSFVCHCRRESLLTDPGADTYEAGYFGDERYEYLATRSLGHSVPLVNGCEQAAGSEHRAEVVERSASRERDRFVLDLAGCYPDEAGLDSLHREFVLDRSVDPDGRLRVSDEATFDREGDHEFESTFVSYAPMSERDGTVTVDGETARAVLESDGRVDLEVEQVRDAIGGEDLWRLRVRPAVRDGRASVPVSVTPERPE
jgi:hypothetical protein